MKGLTPEQFAGIAKAAAANRSKVKSVAVSGYGIMARIASRSGKMTYEWHFTFDPVTGQCEYFGPFADANEPKFLIEAIQEAMRRS